MDEKSTDLIWSLWAVSVMLKKKIKKKNLREIFMLPYLEYSTIFIVFSLVRITFGWHVFMTKWSESILYGVAVYKK